MTRTLVLKRIWLNLHLIQRMYYDKKTKKFYDVTSYYLPSGKYVKHSYQEEITHNEAREIVNRCIEQNKVYTQQKVYINTAFFTPKI